MATERSKPHSTPSSGSHVTSELHRLGDLPVAELTIEDLRLLAAQETRLDEVVPVALARLQPQPLAHGDFYPGDLLVALLRLSSQFWEGRRDWRRRLDDIARPVFDRFSTMGHHKREQYSLTADSIISAYEAFSRAQPAKA
jgi:hypothetical protein